MTSPARYSRLSIGLHWLMLLLIIAGYTFILIRGEFPKGSEPRALVKMLARTMRSNVRRMPRCT